jgi:putative endonuclease
MSYFVYIIFSKACNNFYTGHTQDLENRILEHNSGEGNFTSRCSPWTLVWAITLSSRGEAMKLENKIKRRGAKRFLDDNLIPIERTSRGA